MKPGQLLTIVLLGFLCLVGAAKKKKKGRVAAILEDFTVCTDKEVTANFTFHGKDDYRVNVRFNIPQPVSDVEYINTFERCEGGIGDSCEQFLTVPMSDFCKFSVKMDAQVWSVFLESVTPKLLCPLHGEYIIEDFRIRETVDKLTSFAAVDAKSDRYHYRWTMRFIDKTRNSVMVCLQLNAYLKQMRTE